MKDSVPLYQRMKDQLITGILDGQWAVGERLPSEPDLAEQFAVSRTTVRQAIGDLVSSGYVVRQQGKGTFVSRRPSRLNSSVLYGFAEELRTRGLEVSLRIEGAGIGPCPPEAALPLQTSPTTPVIQISRTAYVHDRCYFSELSYLLVPFRSNPEELVQSPEAFDHVYGFFERHGVKIALGRQSIQAQSATETDVHQFGVALGAPMLVVKRISQDESGAPVEFSQVRYPGDLYAYEVHLLRPGIS